MGTLGTATDYTADVIKHFSPDLDVNTYLFRAYGNRPDFMRANLPYMSSSGLNIVHYLRCYESFPQRCPSVERYVEEGGIWRPEYKEFDAQQSKWIRGLEGEVHLGVELLEEVVRVCTQEYLQ
jgi:hypothetical protein